MWYSSQRGRRVHAGNKAALVHYCNGVQLFADNPGVINMDVEHERPCSGSLLLWLAWPCHHFQHIRSPATPHDVVAARCQ